MTYQGKDVRFSESRELVDKCYRCCDGDIVAIYFEAGMQKYFGMCKLHRDLAFGVEFGTGWEPYRLNEELVFVFQADEE